MRRPQSSVLIFIPGGNNSPDFTVARVNLQDGVKLLNPTVMKTLIDQACQPHYLEGFSGYVSNR